MWGDMSPCPKCKAEAHPHITTRDRFGRRHIEYRCACGWSWVEVKEAKWG